MQFQYNSDYPGLSSLAATAGAENGIVTAGSADGVTQPFAPILVSETVPARPPPDFPVVQPISCARITTRVYHPSRHQVATVQNVLVAVTPSEETEDDALFSDSSQDTEDGDDDRMHSSMSSLNTNNNSNNRQGTFLPQSQVPSSANSTRQKRAYWIQRTIREAIYGRVMFAIVLIPCVAHNEAGAEWQVTDQYCAVKEMAWQHIRKERHRLAEDPIKEVAAMQYLQQWWLQQQQQHQQQQSGNGSMTVMDSFQAMLETNLMMPLDLLSDDRNLYSIMPYCEGGELFERLDMNEKFSEDEARYWMHQLLRGLENLQNAGICHRDLSLENLLVHKNGALIIDLGMCLRLPFVEDSLTASMQNMTIMNNPQQQVTVNARRKRRCLVQPQGTCGKWIYMSPEIYKNKESFDGFSVDMWAAGVILFLMLTGFPPWERACSTDERFKYMSAGYLVQMLTEWDIGITPDAMDLLQRMLFLDPKDRLSLDQVRAHPWMLNGPQVPPHMNPAGGGI